jgi:hypothetical protein
MSDTYFISTLTLPGIAAISCYIKSLSKIKIEHKCHLTQKGIKQPQMDANEPKKE